MLTRSIHAEPAVEIQPVSARQETLCGPAFMLVELTNQDQKLACCGGDIGVEFSDLIAEAVSVCLHETGVSEHGIPLSNGYTVYSYSISLTH